MKNIFFILACLLLIAFQTIQPQEILSGKRYELTYTLNLDSNQFAQIFIPEYFAVPSDGKFNLIIHFHGSSKAAEESVVKSGVNAVLFNIHLGALSSPYKNYFSDKNKFQEIIQVILSAIDSSLIIINPKIDKLIITSFSAGYAAVRELLKNSDYYDMIDAIALADGLHCDSDSALMKQQMKDFVRFAEDAVKKKKIFALTHSGISTEGYQSTTQTTDYILNTLSKRRTIVSEFDEIGELTSKFKSGFFMLRGYEGNSAEDHLKHLRGMRIMIKDIFEISN